MMRGWKWEYFKLDFSFFGWYLLNFLLAAGVELIFAYPVLLELLQATEIDPAILDQWAQPSLDCRAAVHAGPDPPLPVAVAPMSPSPTPDSMRR